MRAGFSALLLMLLLLGCTSTQAGINSSAGNVTEFEPVWDVSELNSQIALPLTELSGFQDCEGKVYFFYDPYCPECPQLEQILENLTANISGLSLEKFCAPMYYHEGAQAECGQLSSQVSDYSVDGHSNEVPYIVFNCRYARNSSISDPEKEEEELRKIMCFFANSSEGICDPYPSDLSKIDSEILLKNGTQFVIIEFRDALNYRNFNHYNIDLKANGLEYQQLYSGKLALFTGEKDGIENVSGLDFVERIYSSTGELRDLVQTENVGIYYFHSGKDQQNLSSVFQEASGVLSDTVAFSSDYSVDSWTEGDRLFFSMLFEDTPAIVVSGMSSARVEPTVKDIVQAVCARVENQHCSDFRGGYPDQVKVIMFYSPLCSHCNAELPVVSEIEEEMGHYLNVTRINVLETSHAEDLLIAKYNVYAIPYFVVNDYRVFSGAKEKSELKELFCQELQDPENVC